MTSQATPSAAMNFYKALQPKVMDLVQSAKRLDHGALRGEQLRTLNFMSLAVGSVLCCFLPWLVAGTYAGTFSTATAAADFIRFLGVYMGATAYFAWCSQPKAHTRVFLALWIASGLLNGYIAAYGTLGFVTALNFFFCLAMAALFARQDGQLTF